MGLRSTFGIVAVLTLVGAGSALAQERGFRLHRYEGTVAGSSQFLVERPWYSGTRYFAIGLTGDYAHRVLVPRLATGRGEIAPVISDAFLGHLDVAGSLFDRVLLSASLPVTIREVGVAEPVSQVGPQQLALGDPRVGVMVRLVGQPERDGFSLHLGADAWVPIGAQATHQGDSALRILPRAVLAGAFGVGRWTLDAGFLLRSYASYGPPALGMTAASEARAGLALGVSLANDRLYLGPEAQFAVQVFGDNAFAVNGMNLEVLGGLHYLIADHLLLGVAGGTAFFGAAGTPDARAMVRIAWAPRHEADKEKADETPPPKPGDACPPDSTTEGCTEVASADDADRDGVSDELDRCPFEPETKNGIRDADGCPEFEMEKGAPLARVMAPKSNPPPKVVATADAGVATLKPSTQAPTSTQTPPPVSASTPDAGVVDRAVAFATSDSDKDGVPDEADRCPVTPEDLDGFEDDDGCPELDNDQDSVVDSKDKCPVEAETENGVDDGDGCPDLAKDADDDGVADVADRCPFEAETIDGVRDGDGCPEYAVPAQEALSKLLIPVEQPVPGANASVSPEELSRGPVVTLDADKDGVLDEADRCPVTPEDLDGFEDEDGCPEDDNDEDAIADIHDACIDVAETVNGFQDEDGCPDVVPLVDVDNDGLGYDADRCPLEPGDAVDGCPHEPLPALALPGFPGAVKPSAAPPAPAGESSPAPTAELMPDLDRDGVLDEADNCPMSPEDKDDFEDEDGCPELDNDHDGVADADDTCPFVAETINGVKDDDGCPDKGAGAVFIQADHVVIKGVVQFKTGSATLQPASLPLLRQVASTLKAAASLSVEIQGHTDDAGNAAANIRLSQRRAETIRGVLVKAGVAPTRLVAKGYGPTKPRATNKTAKGRELNRRVEFLILGESQ